MGGAQVAGRAFALRELDRERRPRVAAHHRLRGEEGKRRAEHREAALARGDPPGEEVDARLLELVGGLGPGGERVARLLELAARDVRARQRREEQPGGPVVAGEALQEERAVRVLLGVVVLAARDRELRERGERQAELERVLRAVGDVEALERARLGLVEAAEPREHERHAEHRTAREQRVVVRGARVRDAVLQRGQRPCEVVARPLRHAQRGGRARAYAEWSSFSAAIAIARSAHCVACFMRHSTQYDCDSSTSASAASSGASASTSSTSASSGPRSDTTSSISWVPMAQRMRQRCSSVRVSASASSPSSSSAASKWATAGASCRLPRRLSPARRWSSASSSGACGCVERGLVVARRLVPRAARQRVVAGGAHARERLGVGDRVAGDEVVRDRARLAGRRRLAVQVADRVASATRGRTRCARRPGG